MWSWMGRRLSPGHHRPSRRWTTQSRARRPSGASVGTNSARGRRGSMTELSNPTPIVRIDGQAHGDLNRDLERVVVEDTIDGLKRLELALVAQRDAELENEEVVLYLDGNTIGFGKAIEVAIGYHSNARTVFKGKISAIE